MSLSRRRTFKNFMQPFLSNDAEDLKLGLYPDKPELLF